MAPNPARRKLAESSLMAFGMTYFPHLVKKPCAPFHREMFAEIEAVLPGGYLVGVLPKGHAKSTWATVILPLYVAATGVKTFIRIFTDDKEKAAEKLGEVLYYVHEANHPLKEDYGDELLPAQGYRNRELKFKDNEAVLGNGCKLKSLYFGQPCRGHNWRGQRPHMDILDDPEDEKNVGVPRWRRQMQRWYNDQLLGGQGPNPTLVHLGTLVHYDSILQWLLTPPVGEKTEADGWRRLTRFRDCYVEPPSDACPDGIPLWPEEWPPDRLAKLRRTLGPRSFDQEMRNMPVSDETQRFRREWFKNYNAADLQIVGRTWTLPLPTDERVRLPLDLIMAVDPALGEEMQHCFSAYIVLGQMHPPGSAEPLIFILDAQHDRVGPQQQVDRIQRVYEVWRPRIVGIEAFIFQKLIAVEAALRNIPVHEVKDSARSKLQRIDASSVPVEQGRVYFPTDRPAMGWFLDEAERYPSGSVVDGLDAFAHGVDMCGQAPGGSQFHQARRRLTVVRSAA